MKLLAFETTSERGSVAIVEQEGKDAARILAYAFHNKPNEQAERLLSMVKDVLDTSGIKLGELQRIVAGVGPGSFTGARIGVAQAQGLALGLGIEGLGVGSLQTIAAGLSPDDRRIRVVIRDARRSEYFFAAYDVEGAEVVAPQTIPQEGASKRIDGLFQVGNFVILGDRLEEHAHFADSLTDVPDARSLGRLAVALSPKDYPLIPQYLRGPVVVKPKLPVSPLAAPRQD